MSETHPGNCKLCKETPVAANYGSPRLCAFDAAGNFTANNWNCCTANFIRERCGEDGDREGEEFMCVRRDDQSYAAIWVPPHPEDLPEGQCVGPFRGGGFLALTWYKHRGKTDAIIRVDGYPPGKPLTLAEADQVVENLRLRGDSL